MGTHSKAGIFSVTSFCGPYAGTANTASVTVSCRRMLAERQVIIVTPIYRWVQRYAPEMEKRLRWYWRNPSRSLPVACWMKPT